MYVIQLSWLAGQSDTDRHSGNFNIRKQSKINMNEFTAKNNNMYVRIYPTKIVCH